MPAQPLVIWQLADGRAGHERQVQGLLDALARRTAIETHRIEVGARGLRAALDAWRRHFPAGHGLPTPQLIVGAGHASHWSLLAASRASSAKSVCLMRPSLPLGWFDVVIVPAHDQPRAHPAVWVSEGVLNPMTPATEKESSHGLILVGGPSRHHHCDDTQVLAAIDQILSLDKTMHWTLCDSPRTPPRLRTACGEINHDRLSWVPFDSVDRSWLTNRLGRASRAYVTSDSVNMIFEALTSGADVGIIEMPAARTDRVSAIVPDLIANHRVHALGHDSVGPQQLAEADRIAALLLDRFPQLSAANGEPT